MSAGRTGIVGLFLTGILLVSAASAAEPKYLVGVAADSKGTLYLADRQLHSVLKVVDGKAEIFVEGTAQYRTPMNAVRCVYVTRSGVLLAGDSATRDIYRIDEAGKATPLTGGKIGVPMAIAEGKDGEIYVSDLELHRIWTLSLEKPEAVQFANIAGVRGLAVDAEGRLIAVRANKPQVVRYGKDGKQEVLVADRVMNFPSQVVLGEDGTAYIADGYEKTVWKLPVGANAPVKWVSGAPFDHPVGLWMQEKAVLVVDPRAGGVFKIGEDAKPVKIFPTGG